MHGADVIRYVTELPQLETIRVKKGFWLSTETVKRMVDDCPRLQHLNLRESGMKQKMPWAIKGTRKEIIDILKNEPIQASVEP